MVDTSIPERHYCQREPKPEGCRGHVNQVVVPCNAVDDGKGCWVYRLVDGGSIYSHDMSHGAQKAEVGKG